MLDPNSILFLLVAGTMLGALLGFMISAEGYGWFFNALAGGLGAVFGGQLLATTGADMGPILNAMAAAGASSTMTALVLRA
jgi:uncharacterized membrane protein YeaQ/YmgE (transglycosylase-associated protein family)